MPSWDQKHGSNDVMGDLSDRQLLPKVVAFGDFHFVALLTGPSNDFLQYMISYLGEMLLGKSRSLVSLNGFIRVQPSLRKEPPWQ